MTIIDYINQKYPIRERVKELISNPYTRIANEDDLPYDKIGPDSNGFVTKLVQVNDEDRYISVIDLISLSEDDRKNDPELANIYDIYMTQVDIEDVNISDIMKSVEAYKSLKKSAEDQVGVLSL